ncbi:hypothetical protein PAXINDRAFT_138172 [Paxillus involutus ATCC 200175]|uniref:C2H2-type domain-containing protein n=1 Tax=Paxillus involutus ATCC 200175 TaxID=664439 RepID=A0A0C9T5K0_PAXIN|nr:hypothetical protein PAXINDRAFT_138172 [Paxillus involutus ATCC 200175]
MPRHSTKHDSAGSQAYSQYSSQYLSDSSQSTAHSPQSPTDSGSLSQSAPVASQSGSKRKHVCTTCDRGFTTSGHLARHLRVHTGERNHKCPFPGCETRCSRQDNLQQHYRIHLSPGSRRSSSSATRAAIARAVGASGSVSKSNRSSSTIITPERPSSDSPSPPPALEHAIPPPPDSPPPLVQAFPVPGYNDSIHSGSVSSRSPTPLENSYPILSPHSQAMTNGHIVSQPSPLQSHYGDSPPSYGEPSQTSPYGYVSSASHPSSTSAVDHSYDYSYSEKSSLPRLQSSSLHQSSMDSLHDPSPPTSAHLSSVSSRLSISHISHPQSYPNHYQAVSTPSPDSAHSVSPHSQASGPSTPNYSGYRADSHDGTTYEPVPDHSGLTNGYISSQNHLVHASYNHSMMPQQNLPRYDSPPPILAPIQDERVIRGDIRVSHVHSPVSSIPPTPLSSSYMQSSMHSYPYHAPHLSLNQGGWKPDGLLRGRS